jgi:signal transduction histidine kinase
MRVRLLFLATSGLLGIVSFRLVQDAPGFSAAGHAPYGEGLLLVAGWAVIIAGLALQRRHPVRRSWSILVAIGFAWFVQEWDSPVASAAVFSVGLVLAGVFPAVVAHLAMSYPAGRLRSRADRALVLAGYLVTVGLQGAAVAVTYSPTQSGCFGCATNLWQLGDDTVLSARMSRAGLWCGFVWSVGLVLALAWRLVARTVQQHAIDSVPVIAMAILVATSGTYAHGLSRGFLGSDSLDTRLWQVQALALLLISGAVVVGLVRSRRSQRTLARTVVDIGNAPNPRAVREVLAAQLHDPDLIVAYPIDGGGQYVDADAHEVDLTHLPSGRAMSTLQYAGSDVAVLVHRAGILNGPEAVGALVAGAHLALENERLHAQSLSQLRDLRNSGARIVLTGDDERRRLERDLHDGAQQRLIGLALGLRLFRSQATSATDDLADAESELHAAIEELRLLAHGLFPVVLRESGLRAALKTLAERRLIRVRTMPNIRYLDAIESSVYLLALRSSEHSAVTVAITNSGSTLVVQIEVDQGVPDLGDIQDRVATLDGDLAVTLLESGALVRLVLPL